MFVYSSVVVWIMLAGLRPKNPSSDTDCQQKNKNDYPKVFFHDANGIPQTKKQMGWPIDLVRLGLGTLVGFNPQTIAHYTNT